MGLCFREDDPQQAIRCFVEAVKEYLFIYFCIIIAYPYRFPLFWGCWEELVTLVQSRSSLVYILSSTSNSPIRNLFWMTAIANHRNV